MTLYKAYYILGVKIPYDVLCRINNNMRGCSHTLSKDTDKYCGTCGAPAWKPLPVGVEPVYDEAREMVSLFPVVIHDNCAFICFLKIEAATNGVGGYIDRNRVTDDFIGDARKAMRDQLTPLGLWCESTFGFWSVLHVTK